MIISKDDMQDLYRHAEDQKDQADHELSEAARALWPEFNAVFHSLGHWKCYGPVGICVYDDDEDSVHDCCLFCGEPEERK